MLFRGREIAHTEPGHKMIAHVIDTLKDVGVVDSPAKLEGKKLIVILAPKCSSKKEIR